MEETRIFVRFEQMIKKVYIKFTLHCTDNEHTYLINEIIDSLLNAIVVKFCMDFS